MDQRTARRLRYEINMATVGAAEAVAITEDHYHGRWERTEVWMVITRFGIIRTPEEWVAMEHPAVAQAMRAEVTGSGYTLGADSP